MTEISVFLLAVSWGYCLLEAALNFLPCGLLHKLSHREFLVVQWLGRGVFTAGARVRSLVWELRSHKPPSHNMAASFFQASNGEWISLVCASRAEPYVYHCNSNHICHILLVTSKSKFPPTPRACPPQLAMWLIESPLCTRNYTRHFSLIISFNPQIILRDEYYESCFTYLEIEVKRNWFWLVQGLPPIHDKSGIQTR